MNLYRLQTHFVLLFCRRLVQDIEILLRTEWWIFSWNSNLWITSTILVSFWRIYIYRSHLGIVYAVSKPFLKVLMMGGSQFSFSFALVLRIDMWVCNKKRALQVLACKTVWSYTFVTVHVILNFFEWWYNFATYATCSLEELM